MLYNLLKIGILKSKQKGWRALNIAYSNNKINNNNDGKRSNTIQNINENRGVDSRINSQKGNKRVEDWK